MNSQFGKIIRIDTKTIRSAGRSTSGVKLLNLDTDDKVAAAVIIPPDESGKAEDGTLPNSRVATPAPQAIQRVNDADERQ